MKRDDARERPDTSKDRSFEDDPRQTRLTWACLLCAGLLSGAAGVAVQAAAAPEAAGTAGGSRRRADPNPAQSHQDRACGRARLSAGAAGRRHHRLQSGASDPGLHALSGPHPEGVCERGRHGEERTRPSSPSIAPTSCRRNSTLIATAGVLDLTTKTLQRLRNLYAQNAAAQKDYEQVDLRPAGRRRRLQGRARGGQSLRQDRCRDRQDRRGAQDRSCPGRALADYRAHHRPQRLAGPARAAGQARRPSISSPTRPSCGCSPTCRRRTRRS